MSSLENNEKGFTLIELTIVILVVSILATISAVVYNNFLKQARVVEAKGFLNALARQETAYYVENDAYTGNLLKLGLPELGKLKYYEVDVVVTPEGYTATAKGNIDSDAYLDVWEIKQDKVLVQINDDIKDLP